jgi:two-component system, NtrC family, sensor histidine kinase HydH
MPEIRHTQASAITFAGIAAIGLNIVAATLLMPTIDDFVDERVRAWLVFGCILLSASIVLISVLIASMRNIVDSKRIKSASALLAHATAMLDMQDSDVEIGNVGDLDSLLESLSRLIKRIERVVDERHQRESEVMRADQLAMVGQMAAGVAHELRNPLTSIKMLVQTGQKGSVSRLTSDDLKIIEQEIRRLERSLQRFLDFARPPRPERRPRNLAAIVERTLALIDGRARKQHVAVGFVPPTEPIVVEVDEDQVQQLLLNLCLNALDVMPLGGALSVNLLSEYNDQVELSVADTGPGISDELMPRLFDPFMSTKETGIGLGLAVSHRIAERHGGTLFAKNTRGGGACFVLRLKRIEAATAVV